MQISYLGTTYNERYSHYMEDSFSRYDLSINGHIYEYCVSENATSLTLQVWKNLGGEVISNIKINGYLPLDVVYPERTINKLLKYALIQ